jgi:uncharacterized protein YndB with AHSA1/START domain
VKKILQFASILLALPPLTGCGISLSGLNQLAAAGSIDEHAPVTAHVQIQIAAPPEKVWQLLADAPSWPTWQKDIGSVSSNGPLASGARFVWKIGNTTIHSQVQLFDPPQVLAWTGTAQTAKAVHVWELHPLPGDQTLVIVKESLDGPFVAKLFPSSHLADADTKWLAALKKTAEAR